MLEVRPVPGIVGVLVGCPEGCGEVIPVLLWKDDIQTPVAAQGAITATVRIEAAPLANAIAEHLAKAHLGS